MYFRDILSMLRRRWYIAVCGLLATIGVCIGVIHYVPPTYEATANVVLLPPQGTQTGAESPGNPYLALGNLGQAADVLSSSLSSGSVSADLEARHPGSTFAVTQDAATSAPILNIKVDAKTSSAAMAGLDDILKVAPETLSSLQAKLSIKSADQIVVEVVSSDTTAKAITKSQIRTLIIAGICTLLLTMLAVAVIDKRLRRRPTKSDRKRDNDTEPAESTEDSSNISADLARAGSARASSMGRSGNSSESAHQQYSSLDEGLRRMTEQASLADPASSSKTLI